MTNESIAQEIVKHSEQLKTVFNEMAKINEKMDAIEGLTLSVEKLAMSVEQLAKNHDEDKKSQKEYQEKVSDKLTELENRPYEDKASKYDRISNQLFTIVFGAVVGYLLKTMFGM